MSNKPGDQIRERIETRNHNMHAFVLPLIALLWLVDKNAADEPKICSEKTKLDLKESCMVKSSNNSVAYKPGTYRHWSLSSDWPIQFTCTTFQLPKSDNCAEEALILTYFHHSSQYFCGRIYVHSNSSSNYLNITLKTSTKFPGGRFVCTAKAISKDEDSRCGRRNTPENAKENITGLNEYPMMAGLVHKFTSVLLCGATIINRRQVLTTVECVPKSEKNYLVVVGIHDLNLVQDTKSKGIYYVEKIVKHDQYEGWSNKLNLALITIVGTISLNDQVEPACLPFLHAHDSLVEYDLKALGWRRNLVSDSPRPLHYARLRVLANSVTSSRYKDIRITNFYSRTREAIACQLQAGGPILWENPSTGQIVLVGVIGKVGDCTRNEPFVSVKVGGAIEWINDNKPKEVDYDTAN